MHTGTGRLNLRDGRRIDVLYQFAGDCDDRRAGYLLFDTRECDDSQFCHRLVLECEDGASVVLVVKATKLTSIVPARNPASQ